VADMTYEQAIEAVRNNVKFSPEFARCGGRTAARRASWVSDEYRRREAVIFHDGALLLNTFPSEDTATWGLDVNAGPWSPSDEEAQATDWEIYELWS